MLMRKRAKKDKAAGQGEGFGPAPATGPGPAAGDQAGPATAQAKTEGSEGLHPKASSTAPLMSHWSEGPQGKPAQAKMEFKGGAAPSGLGTKDVAGGGGGGAWNFDSSWGGVPVQRHGAGPVSMGANLENTGGGSALPKEVQAKMEQGLGADFSAVRVHTDGQAENFGAQAFAAGNNIHFAQGKYDPSSRVGQELLGHELAHVVQQREGRVSAPQGTGGNAAVVQDPALEAEADQKGAAAASGDKPAKAAQAKEASPGSVMQQKPVVQQKPVIQGALPAALLGLGAKLTSETAVAAAGVGGAVMSGIALTGQAGSAIAPGQSGVQSLQLDGWTTDQDKLRLERIAQVRLINAYVDQWLRAHPGEAVTTTSETRTATTTSTTTPRRGGGTTTTGRTTTTEDAGPAASGGQVDQTVMESVKTVVQSNLLRDLNSAQRTVSSQEYMWADSGAHTQDTIGTTGSIKLVDVKGSSLHETLALNSNARQIPALLSIPGLGQSVEVRPFRGGNMRKGSKMSIGYGDALGINVVGGKESKDEAANSQHGKVTLATEWNWDGNTTHMDLDITIDGSGTPTFGAPRWDGTPDDNSYI